MDLDLPRAMRHDVMAGAGLGLRARGQEILVALGGNVVDRYLDLVLFPPLIAKPGQRVVRAGDPVIPHAEGELARGIGVPDIRSGNHTGGRQSGGLEQAAPRHV